MTRLPLFWILILNSFISFAQVIEYSTKVTVEKDVKITEYSFTFQINNPKERWIGEVSIPYQSGSEPEIIEAYIIDKRGNTVRELKKKEVITRSDISRISFFEDHYEKEFSLQWNEYPYRVRYSYKIKEKEFLSLAGWYPMHYFGVYHQHSSLTVDVPDDYEISISERMIDHTYLLQENRKIYSWESSSLFPVKVETQSPPLGSLIPSVTIVPKYFTYAEEGSFATWDEYGQWVLSINEGKDVLPFKEQLAVDLLTKGIEDPVEQIRLLYEYMQGKTKYVNVSIDDGGMVPYPASYVYERGYGDCKALTIYMKALLKHAGIPSNYCLVRAGANTKPVQEDFPCQQFNHAILGIPLEEDTVWLENTSQTIPFNYLGDFTQNRSVLWVDSLESKLVTTPKMSEEDVKEAAKAEFDIQNNMVSIQLELKGESAEKLRHLMKEGEKEELEAQAIDFAGVQMVSSTIQFEEVDNGEATLLVRIEGESKAPVRKIGTIKTISPGKFDLPDLEDPSERIHPVVFPLPRHEIDTSIYHFPEKLDPKKIEIPENQSIDSQFGHYSESYAIDHNTITATRRLIIYQGRYDNGEYLDLFEFFNKIYKSQKRSSIVISDQ